MTADLQPVEIEHRRDHPFEKQTKTGCGQCGRAKTHPVHHGCPPSLNTFGSGNQWAFQSAKKHWQARFRELLAAADFPKPVGRVLVEGQVTFPDRIKRDQGNARFLLEKALGDALVEDGYLTDDDWSRFEFGGLAASYVKGEAACRLILFPSPVDQMEAAA